MLTDAQCVLERALSLATERTARAEVRAIERRLCDIIELQDYDEYLRLLVVPVIIAEHRVENAA